MLVVGMGGDELVTLGVVQLPITIGTVTWPVELCIVLVCPAVVLLGTGALHDCGLSINFECCVLLLPDGHEVTFTMTSEVKAHFGVFLVEDLVLTLLTVTKLHVQVVEGPERWQEEDINLLLEETMQGHSLKTAQVTRSLISSWHDLEDQ